MKKNWWFDVVSSLLDNTTTRRSDRLRTLSPPVTHCCFSKSLWSRPRFQAASSGWSRFATSAVYHSLKFFFFFFPAGLLNSDTPRPAHRCFLLHSSQGKHPSDELACVVCVWCRRKLQPHVCFWSGEFGNSEAAVRYESSRAGKEGSRRKDGCNCVFLTLCVSVLVSCAQDNSDTEWASWQWSEGGWRLGLRKWRRRELNCSSTDKPVLFWIVGLKTVFVLFLCTLKFGFKWKVR